MHFGHNAVDYNGVETKLNRPLLIRQFGTVTESSAKHDLMNCIFCDIIAGKVEASIIYRDEHVCAFMDIQPVNPGHILVVPTAHAIGLSDISAEDAASVFLTAQKMACALKASGLPCEGVNLFLADGAAAMQEVFHLHLHVFPRYSGDGFGLTFSDRYHQKPSRAEIEAAADTVRTALAAMT